MPGSSGHLKRYGAHTESDRSISGTLEPEPETTVLRLAALSADTEGRIATPRASATTTTASRRFLDQKNMPAPSVAGSLESLVNARAHRGTNSTPDTPRLARSLPRGPAGEAAIERQREVWGGASAIHVPPHAKTSHTAPPRRPSPSAHDGVRLKEGEGLFGGGGGSGKLGGEARVGHSSKEHSSLRSLSDVLEICEPHESPADAVAHFPMKSSPVSSDTERYRVQAKAALLRKEEAERVAAQLREKLTSTEAKLQAVKQQKEQQDQQLAGVEERLQSMVKLREISANERQEHDRDFARMRSELQAEKDKSLKAQHSLKLAEQELQRSRQQALDGEKALRQELAVAKRGIEVAQQRASDAEARINDSYCLAEQGAKIQLEAETALQEAQETARRFEQQLAEMTVTLTMKGHEVEAAKRKADQLQQQAAEAAAARETERQETDKLWVQTKTKVTAQCEWLRVQASSVQVAMQSVIDELSAELAGELQRSRLERQHVSARHDQQLALWRSQHDKELKALQAEIVQMRSALEMHKEDMFQAKNERNILQQELERERGEQEMERDRLAAQIDEAHDKARNLHRQLISEKETGARQRESAMHVARHLQEHIHSTAEERQTHDVHHQLQHELRAQKHKVAGMRAACVAKVAALGAELEQSMLQLLDLRAAGGAELQEQWQQLSDKTAAAEARAKEMENELAVANDSVSELQTSLQQQILRQRALQQTLQLSDDEVDAWSQPAAKSASASSLNGMRVGALNMLNPLMGNLDANISLLSGGTAADKRFVAQDSNTPSSWPSLHSDSGADESGAGVSGDTDGQTSTVAPATFTQATSPATPRSMEPRLAFLLAKRLSITDPGEAMEKEKELEKTATSLSNYPAAAAAAAAEESWIADTKELMQQLKRKERDFREAQSELVKVKGALQQERERGVFLLDQNNQLGKKHMEQETLLKQCRDSERSLQMQVTALQQTLQGSLDTENSSKLQVTSLQHEVQDLQQRLEQYTVVSPRSPGSTMAIFQDSSGIMAARSQDRNGHTDEIIFETIPMSPALPTSSAKENQIAAEGAVKSNVEHLARSPLSEPASATPLKQAISAQYPISPKRDEEIVSFVGEDALSRVRLWLRDKAKAAGKAGLSATRVPGLWTEDNPGSGTLKEMGIKKLSKFLYACDDIVCISRPVDTYGNETTDDLRIFPLASVTTALHENQDVSFIEQLLDEVQEQMVQLQDLVNGSQARIKMRNEELLDRAIRQKQMLRREKEQEALILLECEVGMNASEAKMCKVETILYTALRVISQQKSEREQDAGSRKRLQEDRDAAIIEKESTLQDVQSLRVILRGMESRAIEREREHSQALTRVRTELLKEQALRINQLQSLSLLRSQCHQLLEDVRQEVCMIQQAEDQKRVGQEELVSIHLTLHQQAEEILSLRSELKENEHMRMLEAEAQAQKLQMYTKILIDSEQELLALKEAMFKAEEARRGKIHELSTRAAIHMQALVQDHLQQMREVSSSHAQELATNERSYETRLAELIADQQSATQHLNGDLDQRWQEHEKHVTEATATKTEDLVDVRKHWQAKIVDWSAHRFKSTMRRRIFMLMRLAVYQRCSSKIGRSWSCQRRCMRVISRVFSSWKALQTHEMFVQMEQDKETAIAESESERVQALADRQELEEELGRKEVERVHLVEEVQHLQGELSGCLKQLCSARDLSWLPGLLEWYEEILLSKRALLAHHFGEWRAGRGRCKRRMDIGEYGENFSALEAETLDEASQRWLLAEETRRLAQQALSRLDVLVSVTPRRRQRCDEEGTVCDKRQTYDLDAREQTADHGTAIHHAIQFSSRRRQGGAADAEEVEESSDEEESSVDVSRRFSPPAPPHGRPVSPNFRDVTQVDLEEKDQEESKHSSSRTEMPQVLPRIASNSIEALRREEEKELQERDAMKRVALQARGYQGVDLESLSVHHPYCAYPSASGDSFFTKWGGTVATLASSYRGEVEQVILPAGFESADDNLSGKQAPDQQFALLPHLLLDFSVDRRVVDCAGTEHEMNEIIRDEDRDECLPPGEQGDPEKTPQNVTGNAVVPSLWTAGNTPRSIMQFDNPTELQAPADVASESVVKDAFLRKQDNAIIPVLPKSACLNQTSSSNWFRPLQWFRSPAPDALSAPVEPSHPHPIEEFEKGAVEKDYKRDHGREETRMDARASEDGIEAESVPLSPTGSALKIPPSPPGSVASAVSVSSSSSALLLPPHLYKSSRVFINKQLQTMAGRSQGLDVANVLTPTRTSYINVDWGHVDIVTDSISSSDNVVKPVSGLEHARLRTDRNADRNRDRIETLVDGKTEAVLEAVEASSHPEATATETPRETARDLLDHSMECGLLRERYTGKGAYTFKNGNVYEGEFKDGNICGSGIILFPDGRRFKGHFKDNMKHGLGRYEGVSGVYEGNYVNGKKQGFGCFTWNDGSRYEGLWANDLMSGNNGSRVEKDGRVFKVSYAMGKLVRAIDQESLTDEFRDAAGPVVNDVRGCVKDEDLSPRQQNAEFEAPAAKASESMVQDTFLRALPTTGKDQESLETSLHEQESACPNQTASSNWFRPLQWFRSPGPDALDTRSSEDGIEAGSEPLPAAGRALQISDLLNRIRRVEKEYEQDKERD